MGFYMIAIVRALSHVQFGVVATVTSISALMFGYGATVSKLAADEFAKLPNGEGVLSAKTRIRLEGLIQTAYKRAFAFFVLWTCLGIFSSVCGFVEFKISDQIADRTVVLLSVLCFLAAIVSVVTAARAHLRARDSGFELKREIEIAKWRRRDLDNVSASLAELAPGTANAEIDSPVVSLV